MAIAIGVDVANSFVKIASFSHNEDLLDSYPNTRRVVNPFEEKTDVLAPQTKETIYEIDGRAYTVGERGSNLITSSMGDIERYTSQGYIDETLIALAKHTKNGEDVIFCGGVPALHNYNKEMKTKLKELLTKRHTVIINGYPVTFIIRKSYILLQPLGVYMAVVYDSKGNMVQPDLAQEDTLIIDIGWGTTDVAIMRGSTLIRALDGGKAMNFAYKQILDGLRKLYPELHAEKITTLHMEEQLRHGDKFSWGNTEYDCSEIKKIAFDITAGAIIEEVKRGVADEGMTLRSFKSVIFAGGGLLSLSKYFKPYTESFNNVKVPNNSQMASAIGFGIYAKMKG
ncbi:ParM/StbA family protein [Paenibacillus sp. KQZ6P-2]|uniref:ParM/StbA family protein n=1 Tax=Paenibacillus mangrovi TaxID=2931978 RepID=A0A9X1WIR4_9BACL|nr:ParM/StbA family protein [Paenibacillus mangrovi]MCJ8010137.1 ParM/StbA family protein [Paenibacillus mangrovi]